MNGPNATYAPMSVRATRNLTWVGPTIVVLLAALLMAAAARLVTQPDTLGAVQIMNPVEQSVDVDVKHPGGPWLPLAVVDSKTTATVFDVVDVGDPWIIRFRASNEVLAKVQRSHQISSTTTGTSRPDPRQLILPSARVKPLRVVAPNIPRHDDCRGADDRWPPRSTSPSRTSCSTTRRRACTSCSRRGAGATACRSCRRRRSASTRCSSTPPATPTRCSATLLPARRRRHPPRRGDQRGARRVPARGVPGGAHRGPGAGPARGQPAGRERDHPPRSRRWSSCTARS